MTNQDANTDSDTANEHELKRRQTDEQSETIITILTEIKADTQTLNRKVDNLEDHITKKAVIAGTVSGALSGTLASTVMTVGIELIKGKFGG